MKMWQHALNVLTFGLYGRSTGHDACQKLKRNAPESMRARARSDLEDEAERFRESARSLNACTDHTVQLNDALRRLEALTADHGAG